MLWRNITCSGHFSVHCRFWFSAVMKKPYVIGSVVAVLLVQLLGAANAVVNISTDQAALLALKDHVTYDPHKVLMTNWSMDVSLCNWMGVTCGNHHLRVTGLNLSDMGLTGTIPPQLGNMSFLSMLNLKNNSFHGSIPGELAHLSRLNDVNFGCNRLSGQIPSWFGSFPKLQYLNLYANGFTGPIPGTIFNLSLLQVLDLSENKLSGVIPPTTNAASLQYLILTHNQLSGSLTHSNLNISSLRFIDLGDNDLSGSIPRDLFRLVPDLEKLYMPSNMFNGKLPSSLFTCTQLRVLNLPLNNFTGSIARELGQLTSLSLLSLDSNQLQGAIPDEIGNLTNLTLLSLQDNSLTGPVPASLFNVTSLTSIYLTQNSLEGTLPDNLCQNLPSLEVLYLSYNQLNGILPSKLWQCSELYLLDLSSNRFSGSVPRTIGNLTNLTELYLSDNHLSGSIPNEVGNLQNLKVLSLSINGFNGVIPSSIFNISTLTSISLSMNQLSGTLPSHIDLGVPNLKALYIGENRLTGAIPSTISNLSMLTMLDMPANSFSGIIPSLIGSLSRLQSVNLMDNNLTIENPAQELSLLSRMLELKDLTTLRLSGNPLNIMLPTSFQNTSTSLEYFELGDCKIWGNIPADISNLTSLVLLNLSHNALSGFIPATMWTLKMLQGVYLDENKLQGRISDKVCELVSISDLSLGKNMLSGSLPQCLGNLSALRSLSLDCNKLASPIPLTLSNLKYALHINLSSNSFTGSVPPSIGNLKVVIDIDVSDNLLSGSIPSTFGDLQSLVTLSFARNKLDGSIPDSFGELKSLEYLDLSNNSISGCIPESLGKLSRLRYLNVSLNRLQGRIPTSGSFRNFSAKSFMQNNELCGAPCSPCSSIHHRTEKDLVSILKIAVPVVVSLTTIFVALGVMLIKHRKHKVGETRMELTEDSDSKSFGKFRRVSYDELLQASDGFHENNLLGTGGFGSVYKGTLSDGLSVAIKVFHLTIEAAFKSFYVESEVLSSIRHRNLIRIISCCSSHDFKALVLTYMPQGSLETWLYSENLYLNFLERINIMVDVASALEYLHHGYSLPIVHCDLKPSNVLMDGDMVAHLSDFGISKLLGEHASMHQTITLATVGYMAPEYGSEGIVSVQGDVYSYGILLMEMFTRRKPTDEIFHTNLSLKLWVANSLPNAVMEVADANFQRREGEQYLAMKDCLAAIMQLSLACSADLPRVRINAKDVVTELSKIRTKFIKDTGRE